MLLPLLEWLLLLLLLLLLLDLDPARPRAP
jgi:hypothetical protein